MTYEFGDLMFTPAVQAQQQRLGSREFYARRASEPASELELGFREARFIQARNSMYIASVSETGWPYVQHRGGPAGFIKILSPRAIGFADYRGNRQYVTTGNLSQDDRVALILVDYGARARLKMLGHARAIGTDDADMAMLRDSDYRARIERGFVIQIVAFDWNCPQHITPRYTRDECRSVVDGEPAD